MRSALLLSTIFILTCSCATIMNEPHTDIRIYTTEPSTIIYRKDTIQTAKNKAKITVERKREPLTLIAQTDSLSKSISIGSRNSFMYWSNISHTGGIGMLFDRNSPKRYTYPGRVYLSSSDTINEYFLYSQAKNKGEWHLHASLPHINFFQLTPKNEGTQKNIGFWGLALGVDYHYAHNQFLNISVAELLDYFVPIPASVYIDGSYEQMRSRYLSLSNHHIIGRFTAGYGLSYARHTWNLRFNGGFEPPPTYAQQPNQRRHNAIGLVFPQYFQLGSSFHLGFVYRPTFFRPNRKVQFKYEHVLSIDFAWKIRVLK